MENNIFDAITKGCLHSVKMLIRDKNIGKQKNKWKHSILHEATYYAVYSKEREEILKAIIKSKIIDVNTKDKEGETALHIVARSGNNVVRIIKILTKAGIDVNAVSSSGETALHLAIEYAKIESFKCKDKINNVLFLIENGADVNIKKEEDGNYPLHLAIKNGNVEIVKLLLKAGANINAKNKIGHTPFSAAVYILEKEINNEIAEIWKKIKKKEVTKKIDGLVNIMKILLKNGAKTEKKINIEINMKY